MVTRCLANSVSDGRRVVLRITSSVSLGLILFTLSILSFHFLFMRKPTSTWLLFALCGHADLVSLTSYSFYICPSLSSVITLHVANVG